MSVVAQDTNLPDFQSPPIDGGFPWIARIAVRELFGLYTYDIPGSDSLSNSMLPMSILYGDNGSGKTTLLRLLYHTLSPAGNLGHRTYLLNTPFRRFEIYFANGQSVRANRDGDEIEGSFTLSFRSKGKVIASTKFNSRSSGPSSVTPVSHRQVRLLSFLESLDLELFYLSDTRILQSDNIDLIRRESALTDLHIDDIDDDRRSMLVNRSDMLSVAHHINLEVVMEETARWIREEARQRSTLGDESVNSIYRDVISSIMSPVEEGDTSDLVRTDEVLKVIHDIEQRSKDFSRFGLITTLRLRQFSQAIRKSDNSTRAILYRVMSPYIQGLSARLDALQQLQDLIDSILANVNDMFIHKRVNFSLNRGFTITVESGKVISPNLLSSGERQLLLLLCHAIRGRGKPTIFIIDEPEISLNIKWQRRLLDMLVECTKGSKIQFIFASHSLEILSGHLEAVHKLTSQED